MISFTEFSKHLIAILSSSFFDITRRGLKILKSLIDFMILSEPADSNENKLRQTIIKSNIFQPFCKYDYFPFIANPKTKIFKMHSNKNKIEKAISN